jgi:methionyl aminopeptidase
MIYVGRPTVLAERQVTTARTAMLAGIARVRPGARLGDIGATIQKIAQAQRFNVVRDYCGHGIGLGFHEPPDIPHYGREGTGLELEPGMCFTIEPMLNAGGAATRELPDQWTVVTRDRSLSAQWEHTVAVTESGCEILTLPGVSPTRD